MFWLRKVRRFLLLTSPKQPMMRYRCWLSTISGALLVLNNDGKLEGIISERDILRESAERDKMLRTTKVFQGMTENVIVGCSGRRHRIYHRGHDEEPNQTLANIGE